MSNTDPLTLLLPTHLTHEAPPSSESEVCFDIRSASTLIANMLVGWIMHRACAPPSWRTLMNSKITETHLSKPAYIYLRQSTPGQVRHHQQSTERQYGLRGKALQLGWTEASVRVLDRDLGLSGAHSAAREDFKTLVAEVSMGQVGAVFALEVSRLARSNVDWHRLLRIPL